MIVVNDWAGGIIRPAWSNVVRGEGRAWSRAFASLRRSTEAGTCASRPSQVGDTPSLTTEDPERDRELMRRVVAHDEDALAALYDQYAAAVNGLARSILHDPAMAEEVTHDVFLRLWQQPAAYDPARGTFAGWLLRVTRNRAIDQLRRRRETSESALDADMTGWVVDPEPGPEEQALAGLRRDEVRRALATLTPDQRELLDLAYFTGLSQSQIAARLHRPLGTVKSQIRMAMARLAERLSPGMIHPANPGTRAGDPQ